MFVLGLGWLLSIAGSNDLALIPTLSTLAQTSPLQEPGIVPALPDEQQVDWLLELESRPGQHLYAHLAIYSLWIVAASLFGGWIPGRVQLSHLRFQLLLSFVGGLMLGIGMLHLLPHALFYLGSQRADTAVMFTLGGILLMFFLLRAFHVHHHEPGAVLPVVQVHEELPLAPGTQAPAVPHEHHGHCQHDHAPRGTLGWLGLFLGLGIHALLDGFALGAAMRADAIRPGYLLLGGGVLIAILLHQPLDTLSISALMKQEGWSTTPRRAINLLFGILCPLGALLFLVGVSQLQEGTAEVIGYSLAFSAGIFICISLADLLPEMEFHSHHRLQLSLMLLLGIVIAWGLRFLEPPHLHR